MLDASTLQFWGPKCWVKASQLRVQAVAEGLGLMC